MHTQRLQEHKDTVRDKLEVLVGFKESIFENQTKIDQATYTAEETRKLFWELKTDDLFVQAESNYAKVYQELSRQRNLIEMDFKPEIEQVRIDKTLFVKHAALAQLQKELQQTKYALEQSNSTIQKMEEAATQIGARVQEIEDKSPANRRKKNNLGSKFGISKMDSSKNLADSAKKPSRKHSPKRKM